MCVGGGGATVYWILGTEGGIRTMHLVVSR